MKSKIGKIIIFLFVSIFYSLDAESIDQFNFDVPEIEILENGNLFVGKGRGVIDANNNIVITADKFQYNKNENILNANGNVKVEDKVQNYLIFAEDITYKKNLEQIITDKNSKAIYNDGKIITADKFQYNKNENILNANGNVKVEDKVQNYLIFAEDITYKKSRTNYY